MCLALYVATRSEQPIEAFAGAPELTAQELRTEEAWVRQYFTLPVVRYICWRMSCSCTFQHVICSEPFDFYDGMFEYDESKPTAREDLRNMEALLAHVRAYADADGEVELFAQMDLPWLSDEPAPIGLIEKSIDGLEARTFFFIAQFLYRLRPAGVQPAAGMSSIDR